MLLTLGMPFNSFILKLYKAIFVSRLEKYSKINFELSTYEKENNNNNNNYVIILHFQPMRKKKIIIIILKKLKYKIKGLNLKINLRINFFSLLFFSTKIK